MFWSINKTQTCDLNCVPGVPAQLPAQGLAGGGEGPIQRGATVGGPENPDGSKTQTEGGQTSGGFSLGAPMCELTRPGNIL